MFALHLVSGMGAESFRLLELSVGGEGASEEENSGGKKRVLLSVGGDGRVLMAGGGGVLLEEGDLEVSGGGATFRVRNVQESHDELLVYEMLSYILFLRFDGITIGKTGVAVRHWPLHPLRSGSAEVDHSSRGGHDKCTRFLDVHLLRVYYCRGIDGVGVGPCAVVQLDILLRNRLSIQGGINSRTLALSLRTLYIA